MIAITFLNHICCGHLLEINHKDENTFNNKLSNLEIVTGRQNIIHYRLNKKRLSKNIGTSWNNEKKKWDSCIYINKNHIFLHRSSNELNCNKYYQLALQNLDKFNGNKKEFQQLIKLLI